MTLETLVLILIVWPCVIGLCLAAWFDKRTPLLPHSLHVMAAQPDWRPTPNDWANNEHYRKG